MNELAPLSGFLLPLWRQLDVVPAGETILQVPLRFSVPATPQTEHDGQFSRRIAKSTHDA